MITETEYIVDCPRWVFCSTPVYTGRCSKVCFEMKKKYERICGITDVAYWEHRAEYNDFIWVECSNCGFREEAYKVVVKDGCDTKFSDVKYKFCPMCGKEMRVH